MAALQNGLCVVFCISSRTFLCPGEVMVLHRGSVLERESSGFRAAPSSPLPPGNELLVEVGDLVVERRLNLAQVLFRRLVLRTVPVLSRLIILPFDPRRGDINGN